MEPTTITSPRWTSTTKLLVGLVLVGISAFLLYRFASLITPLLLIVIIVYLLHPLTSALARGLRVSWGVAVNLVFLFSLLVLIGLLAWGGVGLVGQIQSLIRSLQGFIANLPTIVDQLSTRVVSLGPFRFDMRTLDLNALSQELLALVQPLLGRTGDIIAALAGSAASIFGWMFFIFLVSYFVMIESSGLRRDLFKLEIPGYEDDMRRLGLELGRIWNAFLRGQILIFTLALAIYSVLLPALGVRYALGIALMAGLAKFLPYVGPWITWIVMAVVTYIYPIGLFADRPWLYTAIVVGLTLTIDQIIDSFVAPRIMASTLKVHPAAVLVAALVAANLLGLLGVVIAAPILASVTLLVRYIMRKMFDQDPWPEPPTAPVPPLSREWLMRLREYYVRLRPKNDKEQKHGQ